MSVTQRAVAKQLNVSPATVSKAFRSAPDIGHETRARILSEAARMGYQPPLAPSNSGSRQSGQHSATKFAGVFSSRRTKGGGFDDMLYLDGLSEAAQNLNVSLVVQRIDQQGDDLLTRETQPVAMRDGLLSGLVFVHRFEEQVIRRLSATMPAVTITHWVPEASCDHVDSDHVSGVQRLVDHLQQLGHRRIGFMGRRTNFSYELSRFASYQRALLHEGLEIIPEAGVINRDEKSKPIEAAQIMVELLSRDVTAWVCSTDYYAHQIIDSLESMGVSVPDDISLVGFDDLEDVRDLGYRRKLTTVKTRFREMGYTAIERLLRRVDNPSLSPIQILLDCPLVVGDTSGPPNKKSRR